MIKNSQKCHSKNQSKFNINKRNISNILAFMVCSDSRNKINILNIKSSVGSGRFRQNFLSRNRSKPKKFWFLEIITEPNQIDQNSTVRFQLFGFFSPLKLSPKVYPDGSRRMIVSRIIHELVTQTITNSEICSWLRSD